MNKGEGGSGEEERKGKKRMGRWMDRRTDGWMDGWMDSRGVRPVVFGDHTWGFGRALDPRFDDLCILGVWGFKVRRSVRHSVRRSRGGRRNHVRRIWEKKDGKKRGHTNSASFFLVQLGLVAVYIRQACERYTHGVFRAVPTKPPTVPAARSLSSRALFVYSGSGVR